jgi:hypothetical protein
MDPVITPMVIAALGQGVGSFLGNKSQADAAQAAAEAQANAAREALGFQKQVYGETKENYQPYIEAGKTGLGGYQSAIQNYKQPELGYTQKDFNLSNWQDPGYTFRLDQANKAINAATAGKGMTLGSGALKSLQTRGQDMASQEYTNAYDRFLKDSALKYGQASDQYGRNIGFSNQNIANYGNLAGTGERAIGNLGSIGQGAGTQIGNTLGQLGNAQAQGDIAQGKYGAANWQMLGSGMSDLLKQLYPAMNAANP